MQSPHVKRMHLNSEKTFSDFGRQFEYNRERNFNKKISGFTVINFSLRSIPLKQISCTEIPKKSNS